MSENPYRQDNPFLSDESFQEKIKRLEAENAHLRKENANLREALANSGGGDKSYQDWGLFQ